MCAEGCASAHCVGGVRLAQQLAELVAAVLLARRAHLPGEKTPRVKEGSVLVVWGAVWGMTDR